MKVLLSQYENMMKLGTHYDQKLWLIPSSAYAIMGIFYNFIFSSHVLPHVKFLLSIVSLVIFLGFLWQFVGDRSFQLGNQHSLKIIRKKLQMVETNEFSGKQTSEESEKDRWFIKLYRKEKFPKAINVIFYLMLITSVCQIVVAGFLLYGLVINYFPCLSLTTCP